MYYVSRISGVVAVFALLVAGWFSVRLARADADFQNRTPESVARAVDLAPGNTEYLAFRALQLDYDGVDSTAILERIAELNPMASAPRIRLGLAAELRGDSESAEKWLLDATRIDRQFEARWTLANFYFRRQDADQFWNWMRQALEISYGDRRPAFDLCWRMSSDAREILARAIPDRQEALSGYLSYLLETRRLTAAVPVALKLTSGTEAACDAFLEANDAASARAVCRAPSGVFRGTGHGFDWRIIELAGVVHVDLDDPRAVHRIRFDGRQPESCELLRQIVSLKAGARYTLRWEARTSSLPSPTGLEWRVAGRSVPIQSSDDWRVGEVTFTAPSDLVTLTLTYQRPSGQARAEGSVEFVGLAVLPASPLSSGLSDQKAGKTAGLQP